MGEASVVSPCLAPFWFAKSLGFWYLPSCFAPLGNRGGGVETYKLMMSFCDYLVTSTLLTKNCENISFYLQKLTKLENREDNNELISIIMLGQ